MRKIILKEISYISNGTKRERLYENDFYKVKEIRKYDDYLSVSVEPKEKFIPSIKASFDDNEEHIKDFKINTVAYGYLEAETIEKIIDAYKMALLTVEQLEQMYI